MPNRAKPPTTSLRAWSLPWPRHQLRVDAQRTMRQSEWFVREGACMRRDIDDVLCPGYVCACVGWSATAAAVLSSHGCLRFGRSPLCVCVCVVPDDYWMLDDEHTRWGCPGWWPAVGPGQTGRPDAFARHFRAVCVAIDVNIDVVVIVNVDAQQVNERDQRV